MTKITFLAIVFFAGFCTAIYTLGPVADAEGCTQKSGVTASALRSDEFAKSLNAGLHKAVDKAKEAGVNCGRYLSEKTNGIEGGK